MNHLLEKALERGHWRRYFDLLEAKNVLREQMKEVKEKLREITTSIQLLPADELSDDSTLDSN